MVQRFLIFLVFLLGLSGMANAQSQFGRYIGVLKNDRLGQEQLAKLDFVVERQTSQEFRLIAILSLYFGGFDSREYVTYHFDAVTYDVLSGRLVFDQPDQEITLVTSSFGQGRLNAQVRSTSAGDVGTLELTQADSVITSMPLVQPLWGEYRGICDGVGTILQVQTSRSSEDRARIGNPFGTYETTAQFAEVDPSACLGASACVGHVYGEGSYDFFSGSLELSGRARNLSCEVDENGLTCNGCALKRYSNEAVRTVSHAYPNFEGGVPTDAISEEPAASGTATSLGGTYRGYLFHERLGVYQPISLNIVTFQKSGAEGAMALFLSATSAMHFGGFDDGSAVTARFNEKEFPLLASQIVLEQVDGDVDSVIQVTKLGGGVARGTWYSLLFGRVGTFELRNDSMPPLPQAAKILPKLDGRYQAGLWTLDLKTTRRTTPISTVNPFYPMDLSGAMRLQDITANIRIAGGTYDFYTGKIFLRLENESRFTGYVDLASSLYLKRPTPGVGRPLLPHGYQEFSRVSP